MYRGRIAGSGCGRNLSDAVRVVSIAVESISACGLRRRVMSYVRMMRIDAELKMRTLHDMQFVCSSTLEYSYCIVTIDETVRMRDQKYTRGAKQEAQRLTRKWACQPCLTTVRYWTVSSRAPCTGKLISTRKRSQVPCFRTRLLEYCTLLTVL